MHLSISDARKSFGRVQALRGVDLDIPSGGRVALVGPNGSGKSTLIRALLGLVECEGRVLLDGRSPWEDRVALARRLAYVPQLAPSLGATVAEVVALVTATRGLSAGAVARVAAELELDVAEVARRPFRNLSGGMKQKLLLALALAARPALLVLDEPTASLDVRARAQFLGLCAQLPPDVTLLLCSHRSDELEHLTHRVVELAEGRVIADTPRLTTPLTPTPGALAPVPSWSLPS